MEMESSAAAASRGADGGGIELRGMEGVHPESAGQRSQGSRSGDEVGPGMSWSPVKIVDLDPQMRLSIRAHSLPRLNSAFRDTWRFAAVGAMGVMICALPGYADTYAGWHWCGTEHQCNRKVITFSNMTVPWGWPALTYVFVAASSLGETLRNSWQAVTGIVLVVVNNVIIQPSLVGLVYGSGTSVLAVCWTSYILFIVIILALDFGPKARLYALHYNTTWTMLLLNPSTRDQWSKDSEDGYFFPYVGLVCLSRTIFGCAVAILAAWILSNSSGSLARAETALMRWTNIAADLYESAWTLVVRLSASHTGPQGVRAARDDVDAWLSSAASFNDLVAKAQATLDTCWWECFGTRKLKSHCALKAAQSHANRFKDGVEGLAYQIEGVWQTMAVDDHPCTAPSGVAESMEQLKLLVPEVLSLSKGVLEKRLVGPLRSANMGEDTYSMGEYDRDFLTQLQNQIQELRRAREHLRNEDRFSCLTILVVSAIESYSKMVVEIGETTLRLEAIRWRFAGIVTSATKGNINFVLRNTFNIVLGALTCVLLLDHDASVATNIGWLTSKFLGSALRKELQRILGISLPFIVSGAAYSSFGDCSLEGKIILGSMLCVWSFLCLYVMAASKEFVYVALLSGAFAPVFFVRQCNKELHDHDFLVHLAVYKSIRGVVFGVGIMLLGDILLKPRSVRALAARHVLSVWTALREEVEALLGCEANREARDRLSKRKKRATYFGTPLTNAGGERLSSIPGSIAAARAMCTEAALQPFWWHAAFPAQAAEEALRAMEGLRHDLVVLQGLAAGSFCMWDGPLSEKRALLASSALRTDKALHDALAPYLAAKAGWWHELMCAVGRRRRCTFEPEQASVGLRQVASSDAARPTTRETPANSAAEATSARLLRHMEHRLWEIRRAFERWGLA